MTVRREAVSVTPPSRHAGRWKLLLAGQQPLPPQHLDGVFAEGSVLAVVAHPGDETLAMGATLAAIAASGTAVHVLCLTRGEGALAEAGAPAVGLGEARTREFASATERLGVQSSRVDRVADGQVARHACQVERDVLDAVAVLHPGALLTLWSEDTHPDHAAAGQVVDAIGVTTGIPVHQFPLAAVHWADPTALSTPMRPLAVDRVALRARQAALDCYRSLTAPWAPGLAPLLTEDLAGWDQECVLERSPVG